MIRAAGEDQRGRGGSAIGQLLALVPGVNETPRSTWPNPAVRSVAKLSAPGAVAASWSVMVTSLLGAAPWSPSPLTVEVMVQILTVPSGLTRPVMFRRPSVAGAHGRPVAGLLPAGYPARRTGPRCPFCHGRILMRISPAARIGDDQGSRGRSARPGRISDRSVTGPRSRRERHAAQHLSEPGGPFRRKTLRTRRGRCQLVGDGDQLVGVGALVAIAADGRGDGPDPNRAVGVDPAGDVPQAIGGRGPRQAGRRVVARWVSGQANWSALPFLPRKDTNAHIPGCPD